MYFVHKETTASPSLVWGLSFKLHVFLDAERHRTTLPSIRSKVVLHSFLLNREKAGGAVNTRQVATSLLVFTYETRGLGTAHTDKSGRQLQCQSHQQSQGTVPTWSTIFITVSGHRNFRSDKEEGSILALILLCPFSVCLWGFSVLLN